MFTARGFFDFRGTKFTVSAIYPPEKQKFLNDKLRESAVANGIESFWPLAAKMGNEFVTYLKSFQAMRAGYASGNFVYGLFTAWNLYGGAK